MAPSMSSSHPASETPKFDFPSNLKSSESFRFSPGSINGAGFHWSKAGPEKSNPPSRSKPRLTKIRRKQAAAREVGESVATDLGLSVSRDEVKLDCNFGDSAAGESKSAGFNWSANNGAWDGLGFVLGKRLDLNLESEPCSDSGVDKNESLLNLNFSRQEIKAEKSSDIKFTLEQEVLNNDGGFRFRFPFDQCREDSSNSFIFGSTKNESTGSSSGSKIEKNASVKDGGNADTDTNCVENNQKFMFGSGKSDVKSGVDSEDNPTSTYKDMFNFASGGKEDDKFPNARRDGVFVFGGLNEKGGFNSCGDNGFGQHINNSVSDSSFKFQSSGTSGRVFEENSSFCISNEMNKLNIDETSRRGSFFPVKGGVFVFGSNLSNPESSGNSSSFSTDGGFGILKNGSSMNKDDTDGKFSGADQSDMKFAFPSFSFTLGRDNENAEPQVKKRSKKKNGKTRPKTIVEQLLGGNKVQQNQNSCDVGSPMDFSPYQDANDGTKVTGEYVAGETDAVETNSNLSPSVPSQDGLSSVRNVYKKKYKLKVGSNRKVQCNDSDKENAEQEPRGTTPHEVCEHWRIRGNEAYHAGKLSKAEEFYTMGINSVAHVSTLGYSMKPLLLCYSNRAATRMSLGRMVEAIGDCTKAAALEPNFLKVILRAGNCYLVLGEIEEAIQCFGKCLNSGSDFCLDRRFTIEAAEGLQKAKKVAEHMRESTKLLQEGTPDAASSALENIDAALSISRYSERLFELKAEALCNMRMYIEAINFCEQTLDVTKKNYDPDHSDNPNYKNPRVKSWRRNLQIKSYYHLGKLELALELIEKQEKLGVSDSNSESSIQDLPISFAATVRDLLCLKKSGNEAFTAGRYAEAIEFYTSAISKSFESRPFMAVCFCNRAAAYQSLNQIVDAIADCSIAIALDENYQKAISRRATLYEMIRDYKQAAIDLQSLVELLARKSQAKNQQNDSQSRSSGGGSVRDLRKARRRLSSVEEKAKEEISLDHYLILNQIIRHRI
ncbi:TPR repeat-containing thioredoxin TTL4 isoform X2 [Andrographis paniculata]|uniref:TPR repeat-containing thioredoxin TTL4 isoform X2 n=1 Tax=Andrographis paniculata TaxID=175694 RepID=UPI0021E7F848|nr:TPR repeat-containing thioredoxin TTL4 isoform X2 [Andrographis paniculata]